jgi:hypothetical protein
LDSKRELAYCFAISRFVVVLVKIVTAHAESLRIFRRFAYNPGIGMPDLLQVFQTLELRNKFFIRHVKIIYAGINHCFKSVECGTYFPLISKHKILKIIQNYICYLTINYCFESSEFVAGMKINRKSYSMRYMSMIRCANAWNFLILWLSVFTFTSIKGSLLYRYTNSSPSLLT